ncbi:MAG: hypothetical protein Q4E74_09420 [Ruminococcus sp.]|nr:hypothetical protein [Ruminococcus sp.]
MKTEKDIEDFLEYGADRLFSAVLNVTKDRRRAVSILTEVTEDYCLCRKKFKTVSAAYRYIRKKCEKKMKCALPKLAEDAYLTDEEKESIMTSAKLKMSSGIKKERLTAIIVAGAIALIIALTAAYAINFVDKYGAGGMTQWYEKEENQKEQWGWNHTEQEEKQQWYWENWAPLT